jgi:excisionase family DNA binding protein
LPGISNAEKRTLRRSCPVPDRRLPTVPPILLDALNRPIPQADTHPDVTPVRVWVEEPALCPAPGLLTIDEVAAALRVCTKTVQRRIKDGTIRTVAMGGRLVRIASDELLRLSRQGGVSAVTNDPDIAK